MSASLPPVSPDDESGSTTNNDTVEAPAAATAPAAAAAEVAIAAAQAPEPPAVNKEEIKQQDTTTSKVDEAGKVVDDAPKVVVDGSKVVVAPKSSAVLVDELTALVERLGSDCAVSAEIKACVAALAVSIKSPPKKSNARKSPGVKPSKKSAGSVDKSIKAKAVSPPAQEIPQQQQQQQQQQQRQQRGGAKGRNQQSNNNNNRFGRGEQPGYMYPNDHRTHIFGQHYAEYNQEMMWSGGYPQAHPVHSPGGYAPIPGAAVQALYDAHQQVHRDENSRRRNWEGKQERSKDAVKAKLRQATTVGEVEAAMVEASKLKMTHELAMAEKKLQKLGGGAPKSILVKDEPSSPEAATEAPVS